MSIPFIQYLRPNRRRVKVTIDRPETVETLARACLDAGIIFEAEHLGSNMVDFEAVRLNPDTQDYDTVAAEVVPNGPPVLDAVDRLVRRAYAQVEPREKR